MSLNRTSGLQLFQGEITAQHHKNVEITFKKVKYSSEHLKGTKNGQLYLTNFRLFFVNDKKNEMLQNLSMPFKLIKDFEIKQPLFGANYLEGKILAEEGGGWQGSAEFSMIFKAGGAVEVGESLVKMAQNPQMMYIARPTVIMTGAPQTVIPQHQQAYAPPPAGYYPTAPPMYSPPQQPYDPNPAYPPQQPYNVNPNLAYPPQPQPYPAPDPKAQEAMASNSYLPPGYDAPLQNPPPYDAAMKKDQ